MTDKESTAREAGATAPRSGDEVSASPRAKYGTPSFMVAGLFGLLYAYDLWEAISNFVELPVVYEYYGLDTSAIPWWVLVIGVAVPAVIFALAVIIGRGQNILGRILIFFLGLAIVAGLSLGVLALEVVLRPELVVLTPL